MHCRTTLTLFYRYDQKTIKSHPLPDTRTVDFRVEAVDLSRSSIIYEGLENLCKLLCAQTEHSGYCWVNSVLYIGLIFLGPVADIKWEKVIGSVSCSLYGI